MDHNGISLLPKTRRKSLGPFYEEEKLNIHNKDKFSSYNKYIVCPSDYKCNLISSNKAEGVCCPLSTQEESNKFEYSELLNLQSSEYQTQSTEQLHQQTSEYSL